MPATKRQQEGTVNHFLNGVGNGGGAAGETRALFVSRWDSFPKRSPTGFVAEMLPSSKPENAQVCVKYEGIPRVHNIRACRSCVSTRRKAPRILFSYSYSTTARGERKAAGTWREVPPISRMCVTPDVNNTAKVLSAEPFTSAIRSVGL